jgi:hypothetical protein
MNSRNHKAAAHPETVEEQHRHALEALEHVVHHETTKHSPKLHAEKVKAAPLDPRSQERRFPK